MDVTRLQTGLIAQGADPGPVDGLAGMRTYRALICFLAGKDLDGEADQLAAGMVAHLGPALINTRLRLMHWCAQGAYETTGYKNLIELGGADYFTQHYEGRADLGNTQPGDGARFCGRGVFMITGRANYARYGARVGVDLVASPILAARPDIAVATACLYWSDRKLNDLADEDDAVTITKRINGGLNGLDGRIEFLNRLREIWPDA